MDSEDSDGTEQLSMLGHEQEQEQDSGGDATEQEFNPGMGEQQSLGSVKITDLDPDVALGGAPPLGATEQLGAMEMQPPWKRLDYGTTWDVRVLACDNPDRLPIAGGTLWSRSTSLYSKRVLIGSDTLSEPARYSTPMDALSLLRIPSRTGGGSVSAFMGFVAGVLAPGANIVLEIAGLRDAVAAIGWNHSFELLLSVPLWRWLDMRREGSVEDMQRWGRGLPERYRVFVGPRDARADSVGSRVAWSMVASNSVPDDLLTFWEYSDAVMVGGARGMLVDGRLFGVDAGSVLLQASQRWALAGSVARAVALTMSPMELMYLLAGVELPSLKTAAALMGVATFGDMRTMMLEQISFWGADWVCGPIPKSYAGATPTTSVSLEVLARTHPPESAYGVSYAGETMGSDIAVEQDARRNRLMVEFFAETAVFEQSSGYRLKSLEELGWVPEQGRGLPAEPRLGVSFMWTSRFAEKNASVRVAALGAYATVSRFVQVLRQSLTYGEIQDVLSGNAGASADVALRRLGVRGDTSEQTVARWNEYAPALRGVFGAGSGRSDVYLDRGLSERGPLAHRAYEALGGVLSDLVLSGNACPPRVSVAMYVALSAGTDPVLLDASDTVQFEGAVWMKLGQGYDRLVDGAYWVEQNEDAQKVYTADGQTRVFRILAVTRSDGDAVAMDILREKSGEDVADYFRRGRLGEMELACAQRVVDASWIYIRGSGVRGGMVVLPLKDAGRFVGEEVVVDTVRGSWYRPSMALVRLLCDKKTALLQRLGDDGLLLRALPDYDPVTGGLVAGGEFLATVKLGLAVADETTGVVSVVVHGSEAEAERRRMLVMDVGTERERVDMLARERVVNTDIRGHMVVELATAMAAWQKQTGLAAAVTAEEIVGVLWDSSPENERVGSLAGRFARSFILLSPQNPVGKHARYYRYMLFMGYLDPRDYFVRDAWPRALFPELFSRQEDTVPLYVFAEFRDKWCSTFVRYMLGKMLFSWNFKVRELRHLREEMAALSAEKLDYVRRRVGDRDHQGELFEDSMGGAVLSKQDEEAFAAFAGRVGESVAARGRKSERFFFYEEDGVYYAFSGATLRRTAFANPVTKKALEPAFIAFVKRSQNSQGALKQKGLAARETSQAREKMRKLGGYKRIMAELLEMRSVGRVDASGEDVCALCSVAFGVAPDASGLAAMRCSPLLRLKGDMANYCSEKCKTDREYGSFIGELVGFVSARRIVALEKLSQKREAVEYAEDAQWERQEKAHGARNEETVATLVSTLQGLQEERAALQDDDPAAATALVEKGPPGQHDGTTKSKNLARQQALTEVFDENLVRVGLEGDARARSVLDERIRDQEEKLARAERVIVRADKRVQCEVCRKKVKADQTMRTVIADTTIEVTTCSAECAADIMSPADADADADADDGSADIEEDFGPAPGPRPAPTSG